MYMLDQLGTANHHNGTAKFIDIEQLYVICVNSHSAIIVLEIVYYFTSFTCQYSNFVISYPWLILQIMEGI